LETTEALPLTCMPSLATLAEVGLMAADLMRLEIMLIVVWLVVNEVVCSW
jgi:hypothetical protein